MPFDSQPRGLGLWHILAMLSIASVVATVAYQNKGYPSEDTVDGKSMTALEHIARLNALEDSVAREMRHKVTLKDSCTLEFTSLRRSPQGNAFDVPLLTLDTSSRTDQATGLILVELSSLDGPDAPTHEVYETDKWYEAIAYRSHLRQLTRLCVETQPKLAPDLPAGTN
jgi:hypothetical protein